MAIVTKEAITESSAKRKRQSVYSKAGFVAFKKARLSGAPVCFTEGNIIYKMFPDGKKNVIGHVEPLVKLDRKVFCI